MGSHHTNTNKNNHIKSFYKKSSQILKCFSVPFISNSVILAESIRTDKRVRPVTPTARPPNLVIKTGNLSSKLSDINEFKSPNPFSPNPFQNSKTHITPIETIESHKELRSDLFSLFNIQGSDSSNQSANRNEDHRNQDRDNTEGFDQDNNDNSPDMSLSGDVSQRNIIAQGRNYFDLNLFNKIVPQFKGDQPSLKIFIRRCETYLRTLSPDNEEIMVASLVYKLSGKAFLAYEEKTFTAWEDFRKSLIEAVDGGKSLTML